MELWLFLAIIAIVKLVRPTKSLCNLGNFFLTFDIVSTKPVPIVTPDVFGCLSHIHWYNQKDILVFNRLKIKFATEKINNKKLLRIIWESAMNIISAVWDNMRHDVTERPSDLVVCSDYSNVWISLSVPKNTSEVQSEALYVKVKRF